MKRKKIVFITHQMGTQGSYLNLLDLQQYLRTVEEYDIKFYCENVKKLFKVRKDSRRTYKYRSGEIKTLTKDIIEPETVITDFNTIIQLSEKGMSVICKKLIIMDTVELAYHLKGIRNARFFYDINLYKVLEHFYANEIVFLMPPNNYEIFQKKYPDLNAHIFFKKINVDMVDRIKYKRYGGNFFRWDDDLTYKNEVRSKYGMDCFCYEPEWTTNQNGASVPLKYKEADHIFDYQAFIYRRRKYLEYEEQFGRLIFEYILLGKPVYFMGNKYTNDGLSDYLKHYNIQFIGDKIITKREDLRKQMEYYTFKPWEN